MEQITVTVQAVNSDTVLSRVIETIKRRRITIIKLIAEVKEGSDDCGMIEIRMIADHEKLRLLKTQIEKIIDVLAVY